MWFWVLLLTGGFLARVILNKKNWIHTADLICGCGLLVLAGTCLPFFVGTWQWFEIGQAQRFEIALGIVFFIFGIYLVRSAWQSRRAPA